MSSFNAFMDAVYGPLDKGYCVWFYFLSIIGFVVFITSLLGLVIRLITDKKVDFYSIMAHLYFILTFFLMYFVNRLLHTMCVGAK